MGMPNFFQKNKKLILAVVLVGLIAAPLALVPVNQVKAADPTAGDISIWRRVINMGQMLAGGPAYFIPKIVKSVSKVGECLTTPAGFSNCVLGTLGDLIVDLIAPLLNLGLMIAGGVLDLSIKVALDTTWLKNITAINDGWKLIRDLANMGFIFLLLYIAISTILQLSSYNIRSMLTRLIIAAVLINFSFFFTGVVMDAGNIVASNFYSALTSNGTASLSRQFISLSKMDTTYIAENNFDQLMGSELASTLSGGSYLVGRILTIILTCIAIYVLFSVGLLFIGRSIAFVFLLMLAPIGFVGKVVPGLSSSADKWWRNLWHQTLLAPVFLILLYLVYNLMKTFDAATLLVGADGKSKVPIEFYFNYILVMGLLIMTLRITRGLSSEIGLMIEKSVKKAMAWTGGVVLGVATAGAAMAGTAAVGGLAARAAASGGLKNLAATTGTGLGASFKRFTGRTGIKLADKVAGSSFDVRNVGVFRKTAGLAGLKVDKSKFREGGYKAVQEKKAEKAREFAEKLAPSAREIQEKTERYESVKENYEKIKTQAREDSSQLITAKEKEITAKETEINQLKTQIKTNPALQPQALAAQVELQRLRNELGSIERQSMERVAETKNTTLEKIERELAAAKAGAESMNPIKTDKGLVFPRQQQYAEQLRQPGYMGVGPMPRPKEEKVIGDAITNLTGTINSIKKTMGEAGSEMGESIAKAVGISADKLKEKLEEALGDVGRLKPGAVESVDLRSSILDKLAKDLGGLKPAFGDKYSAAESNINDIKQNLVNVKQPSITESFVQKVSWTPQWKREAADKIISGEKLKKKGGGKDKKKFLEDLAELLGEETGPTPPPKPPTPPPTPPTTT